MKVYVVESGDYEERGIVLIASSFDSAVTAIKARHGPPYRVHWEEAVATFDNVVTLRGHFEAVSGYSIQHTAEFDITEYEVEQ